jgi:hypothetical protein
VFKDGEVGVVLKRYESAKGVAGVDVLLPQGILNTLESQVKRVQ